MMTGEEPTRLTEAEMLLALKGHRRLPVGVPLGKDGLRQDTTPRERRALTIAKDVFAQHWGDGG